MMPTPFSILILLLGCAMLLSACGGDSEDEDAAESVSVETPTDAATTSSTTLPALSLPQPTGEYHVATHTRQLTDYNREEAATSTTDDYRRLVVQVWYPALDLGIDDKVSWLQPAVGRAFAAAISASFPSNWADSVKTHSREGLPVSLDDLRRFPVLVASHGYITPHNMYTSFFEDLASHGYIVVAVEHPHDTVLTVFPDGSTATLDSSVAQNQPPADASEEQIQEHWAKLDSYIALWVADLRFVLDELEQLDQYDPEGILAGRMDLDRIGVFGHSFGGATAAEVCWLDARVDVGLNIDGAFLSPLRLDGGRAMNKPFMTMLHENYPDYDLSPHNFFERQSGSAYQLVIAGTTHQSFMDLGYVFRGLFGELPDFATTFGSLNSTRAITIIRAYTLALFNKHLQGYEVSLLDTGNTSFPEVTFHSK